METELITEYGYWGEHPDYPAREWQEEVAEGNTRKGYWSWVADRISEDESILFGVGEEA